MTNIAIVGSGNVGSRHLQSIVNVSNSPSIEVIDPSEQSLALGKERFDQVAKDKLFDISYFRTIKKLKKTIDIAVIATTSTVRKQVVKELLQHANVRYLILEKVAFSSEADFIEIISLLKEKGVQAWVNCPQRMYPFYKQLKKEIIGQVISYEHIGGDWSMGSNSIHLVDHLSYLADDEMCTVDYSNLSKEILESKHKGFFNFTGELIVNFSKGSQLLLAADTNDKKSPIIKISTSSVRYLIKESSETAKVAYEKDDWQWNDIPFKMELQSQLTNLVIEQLLAKGRCDLTQLGTSFKLHKPLIESFNNHLKLVTGREYTSCPIT